MKRIALALVVAVLVGLAVADLPKAVSDAWKFKWIKAEESVANKLNGPADCTELEYRCAKASQHYHMATNQKMRLNNFLDMNGAAFTPTKDGLNAVVYLSPYGQYQLNARAALEDACERIRKDASAAICPLEKDWSNFTLTIYFDSHGKPIAVRDAKGFRPN